MVVIGLEISDIPNLYPVIMDLTGRLKKIIDEQKAKKKTISLIDRAKKYSEMGDYQLVLAMLEEVDNADLPSEYSSEIKDLIGLAYIGLGKFEKALEYFEKAIGKNPEYADAWSNKGYALYMLDKPESIASFDTAIHLDKNNLGASYGKAMVFQKSGDLDKAAHLYYDDVIKKHKPDENTPLLGAAYYQLGNIHSKKGDLKEDIELKKFDYDLALGAYDVAITTYEILARNKERDKRDIKSGYDGAAIEDALRENSLYANAWHGKYCALKALDRDEDANLALERLKELGYRTNPSTK